MKYGRLARKNTYVKQAYRYLHSYVFGAAVWIYNQNFAFKLQYLKNIKISKIFIKYKLKTYLLTLTSINYLLNTNFKIYFVSQIRLTKWGSGLRIPQTSAFHRKSTWKFPVGRMYAVVKEVFQLILIITCSTYNIPNFSDFIDHKILWHSCIVINCYVPKSNAP